MIELQNPFGNSASYAACVGVDWGHSKNCVYLLASGADQVERIDVAADPASMGRFIRTLRERFPQGTIAMVSEQTKGALVNLLLDHPFIELMAANPHAAAKFRRSLHPSGSKSDPIDSSALLRMIFTHRDRMPVLLRGDEASRRLDGISRHRRSVVEQRVKVSHRLEDLLRQYYPQALAMLGAENWDPISLAFLRKWPSYSRLIKSKDQTLKSFFYTHGSRSEVAIEKRLDSRRLSAALSSDPLIEELGALQLLNYVERLEMYVKCRQKKGGFSGLGFRHFSIHRLLSLAAEHVWELRKDPLGKSIARASTATTYAAVHHGRTSMGKSIQSTSGNSISRDVFGRWAAPCRSHHFRF
jgi:hypothetical protein